MFSFQMLALFLRARNRVFKLVALHSDFDRQFFPWYAAAQTGGTDGQAISRDIER